MFAAALVFVALFSLAGSGIYKAINPNNTETAPKSKAESAALPFDMPDTATLRNSNKLVFAHYWTPMPISIDNKDGNITDPNNVGADYYTKNYLNPKPVSANEYRHAEYGGLTRERPLPRTPINSTSVDTATCPLPEPTGWRLEDAKTEVRTAIAAGLDGFTLNTIVPPGGGDYRNCQNGYLILQAAQAVDPNFKIVIAPDMSGPLGTMTTDELVAYVAQLASYQSAYKLADGRLVFTPFYPEKYHDAAWWGNFFNALKTKHNIDVAFVPVFLNYTANAASFAPISYGFSNWGNRSPATNANLATNMNDAKARGKIWMQPVTVQDVRPRSSIYDEAANTENLRATWSASFAGADWVHIPTWNDYTENTQIQPSTETGYSPLDLNSYYINKFKGLTPTIKRDALYVSHRVQFYETQPSLLNSTYNGFTYNKLMTLRAGSTPARNTVEVLSFLTAPGDVTVKVGTNTYTYAAPAGEFAKTFPLAVGQVSASMSRAGQLVTDVTSPNLVEANPAVQDLQYKFVSSLRQGKTYTSPVTSGCTVDAKLVNSCRPWLSAAVGGYTMAGDQFTAPIQYPFFEKRLNNPNVLNNPSEATTVTKKLDAVHFYNAPTENALKASQLTYVNRADTFLQLNWKPDNNWALAGGGDATVNARIDGMANSIKAVSPKKIMLSLYHEPEDNVTAGSAGSCYTKSTGNSGSPSDYVKMWQNTRARFDALGVTNVVWNMNYMSYNAYDCLVPLLWPGNNYVDWVTFDPYAGGTTSFAASVQPFYDLLTTKSDATHDYNSKPWGLSEFGYWNQNGNSTETQAPIYWQQVKAAIQNNTFPKLKLYSVFDTNAAGWPALDSYNASLVGLRFSTSNTVTPNIAEQTAYNDFASTLLSKGQTTNVDITAPTVSITSPTSSATVKGTAQTTATASDSVGVSKAELYVNNVLKQTVAGTGPFAASIDTTAYANNVQIEIVWKAYDAAGNVGVANVKAVVNNPDTTAPTTPANLVVTSNLYNSVQLSWGASTDNVGIANYQIKRGGVVIAVVPGTSLTFTDDTVSAGTAYSYQVQAADAANNLSALSNSASASTPQAPDTQAPTAPANVSATAPAYNRVALSWSASTDNKAVAGYYVVRNGVTLASTTSTTYSDANVSANTSYSYTVIAYDAAGNTASSAAASVKTPDIPDTTAPTVPQSLTAQAVSATQINISWAPSTDNIGVTSYKIYRGSTILTTVSAATATSYGDANLTASTSYTYTVVACDVAGNCSAQSTPATVTTLSPPVTQIMGSLSGSVKNQSGSPISRVRVKVVNGTNTYSTSSSSTGNYGYSQLIQGSYSATYSKKGYRPVNSNIIITGGVQAVNNVTLTK